MRLNTMADDLLQGIAGLLKNTRYDEVKLDLKQRRLTLRIRGIGSIVLTVKVKQGGGDTE